MSTELGLALRTHGGLSAESPPLAARASSSVIRTTTCSDRRRHARHGNDDNDCRDGDGESDVHDGLSNHPGESLADMTTLVYVEKEKICVEDAFTPAHPARWLTSKKSVAHEEISDFKVSS